MAAVLVAMPALARAGLEICNETGVRRSVAVGYKADGKWVSEGWWGVESGACKVLVKGDLKNRYYYYRAETKGKASDGTVTFCTSRKAFTIQGDEDCEGRGYDKQQFRKIDTGKTAKHFTLTLTGAKKKTGKAEAEKAPAPAAAPKPAAKPRPAAPSGAQPGTYGEPYSAAAILQGCVNEGVRQCAFHEGGTKFFVYDDGRTPQFVFAVMAGLDPGTPIVVEGDLTGIFDTTAEVVLRDITIRPWDDAVVAVNRLQGHWYSVDDSNSQFTVLGAERELSYDGNFTGREYLWVGNWCGRFEGDGPYLMARPEEGGEEVFCYQIVSLEDWSMELMYLPGGNFLSYRKLD